MVNNFWNFKLNPYSGLGGQNKVQEWLHRTRTDSQTKITPEGMPNIGRKVWIGTKIPISMKKEKKESVLSAKYLDLVLKFPFRCKYSRIRLITTEKCLWLLGSALSFLGVPLDFSHLEWKSSFLKDFQVVNFQPKRKTGSKKILEFNHFRWN